MVTMQTPYYSAFDELMQFNKNQSHNQRNNQLIYNKRQDFKLLVVYGHFAYLFRHFILFANLSWICSCSL